MKVKGNILVARRTFIQKKYGDRGWEKILDSLPEEERQQIDIMISNVTWYPFALCQHLDKAIVRILGGGKVKLFEEMGRVSAQENLTGVHKSFLVPGDPQAFMQKADFIYKYYYDIGHRTYEQKSDKSGVLTTYDAETFSEADCATVIGWYKEALRMCGARNPTVVELVCRARGGAHCQYQVSWE